MESPLRILIAEDSDDDYELLIRELKGAGLLLEAQRVDSESAMVAALERQPWDLVLSDHNMPGFSGLSALALLKERRSGVPFILLSGTVGEDIAVAAMRAGAQDYVMKNARHRLIPAIKRELQESADRNKMEAALREQEEKLRQAQRVEALGRLAGGVAHDFNNILAVISLYAETISSDLPPEDPLHEAAEQIIKAQKRGAGLTRQLLAFSRKQAVVHRVLDLNEVILGLEKMLKPLLGDDITLLFELSSDPALVKGDFGQLEQVVMNLVVNARDAIEKNGTVTIRTQLVEFDTRDNPRALDLSCGMHVKLGVTDSGSGMCTETKAKIFDPFFTTKGVGKGTGLGLAAVHGVLRQMGGAVAVDSAMGKGTTFQLYFPRPDGCAAAPAVEAPVVSPAAGDNLTILYVEDEAALRIVVGKTLRKHGYNVLIATNGVDALAIAEKKGSRINLLVTDVVMPGMGGNELIKRIRESKPDTRVLFMSGYTEDTLHKYEVSTVDSSFIEKPFTTESLVAKIAELLR